METLYRTSTLLKYKMARKTRERVKKQAPQEFKPVGKFELKPQTIGQNEYFNTLQNSDITVAIGCAGTGKSYLSIGLACQYLLEHRVDRIVIARPAIEASPKGLGFLKGDLEEKLSPYLYPAIQLLKKFLTPELFRIEHGKENICFESLEYMRGRTYDYSFMILEEAQNCTFDQLEMFITRIGKDSKILINGDTKQKDIKCHDLEKLFNIFKSSKNKAFGTAELTEEDIVRNPLIKDFLELIEKHK